MKRLFAVLPLFACALLLLAPSGCSRCSSTKLAELMEANGNVERDHEPTQNQWEPAAAGALFEFGDAIRTREQATATVAFDDGARMQLEPMTTVRFLPSPPGTKEQALRVETGHAVLLAGDQEMRLRTEVGLAVLQPGTVARVSRGTKGVRFFVSVGLARLESKDPIELRSGHGVEVGIGMAILERFESESESTEVATAGPSVAAEPTEEETTEPLVITAEVEGDQVRIQAPEEKAFHSLPPGQHTLAPGTQLRLTAEDRVRVRRGGSSAELAGPGTYRIIGEGKRVVEPVVGTITLRAEGKDASTQIPGGKVTALGSSGFSIGEVSVEKGGTVRVRVRAGKVRVEVGEQDSTLSAGERANITQGTVSITGRGPAFADITTMVGTSLVVHDPSPPTAVGFAVDKSCPHVALIEPQGKRTAHSAGSSQVNMLFDAGTHRYQVRCLSRQGELSTVTARGTVTVYHDSGSAVLPTSAPSNVVNTDGRSYTLLYQNLLPSITVRWPHAPSAASYTLTVTSHGGTKTLSTAGASHTFAAGTLGEGTHSFRFRSSEGRTSRTSRATIRFDNAAPKASILSPANGQFSGGSTVRVSGIALPGWQVSARGESLAMDRHHRFSGTVNTGPRGVVLQFSHPRRGVHHYIRRATGAMP